MEFQPNKRALLPLIIACANAFTAFFFTVLLLILKYMACKLLTDKSIKTINKKYPCQVPLDKTAKSITISTYVSYYLTRLLK